MFSRIQLSMDGPAVNWRLLQLLKDVLAELTDSKLLDIGTCGIHVVHGALKSGFQASDWAIQRFIRSEFYVFRYSPACRAAFILVTQSSSFPKPFVGVRWLENGPVVEHLLTILPHLKTFVDAVQNKTVKNVSLSNSYKIMANELKNMHLLRAKLEFFAVIVSELEPFMREFQTNKPLSPHLYDRLRAILTSCMGRFIKPHVMADFKSESDLIKLDLKKEGNCV